MIKRKRNELEEECKCNTYNIKKRKYSICSLNEKELEILVKNINNFSCPIPQEVFINEKLSLEENFNRKMIYYDYLEARMARIKNEIEEIKNYLSEMKMNSSSFQERNRKKTFLLKMILKQKEQFLSRISKTNSRTEFILKFSKFLKEKELIEKIIEYSSSLPSSSFNYQYLSKLLSSPPFSFGNSEIKCIIQSLIHNNNTINNSENENRKVYQSVNISSNKYLSQISSSSSSPLSYQRRRKTRKRKKKKVNNLDSSVIERNIDSYIEQLDNDEIDEFLKRKNNMNMIEIDNKNNNLIKEKNNLKKNENENKETKNNNDVNKIIFNRLIEELEKGRNIEDEFFYCQKCSEKVVLEYVDKPPSLCCPNCGRRRPYLDIRSASVHDKTESTHNPFTYSETGYFNQWLKRITGKSTVDISQEDLDQIYLELYNQKVFHVGDVTWEVVDRVVQNIAKKKCKKFSEFYPYVYAITDIIRTKPLLTLTTDDIQELRNMFKKVFSDWQHYISKEVSYWIDRTNFLSNSIILQLCFCVLDYPTEIVSMFKPMKGDKNIAKYQEICNKLCKRNEWKSFDIEYYNNFKYGRQKSLKEMIETNNSYFEED